MIEVKQNIKFKLLHPLKNSTVDINFYSESDMDDWLPYLNKFEDYLIQEKLKASKKKQ
jgi:hypothetical protein